MRGASNYVFVSPPDHAHFYSELLSLARDDEATGAAPTALCLYTRFDALALARVLGDARARACLKRGCAQRRRGPAFHGLRRLCFASISGCSLRAEPVQGEDGIKWKGSHLGGADWRGRAASATSADRAPSCARRCRLNRVHGLVVAVATPAPSRTPARGSPPPITPSNRQAGRGSPEVDQCTRRSVLRLCSRLHSSLAVAPLAAPRRRGEDLRRGVAGFRRATHLGAAAAPGPRATRRDSRDRMVRDLAGRALGCRRVVALDDR